MRRRITNNPSSQTDNEEEEQHKLSSKDPFEIIVSGNLEDVDAMLNSGISPNLTRWSGFSLLHRAAQLGHTDVCEFLIMNGADVNMRSARGWYTPLHMALSNGYTETASCLLHHGARAWVKSKYDEDPYEYGGKRGFKKVCDEFRAVVMKREMTTLLNKQKEMLLGPDTVSSRPTSRKEKYNHKKS